MNNVMFLPVLFGVSTILAAGLFTIFMLFIWLPRQKERAEEVEAIHAEVTALLADIEFDQQNRERIKQAATREKQEIAARCKEYQDTVNSRLAWNMANAHLYRQGDLAVISVSYDKTSKGKTRRETTVLGVVPKAEVTKLVIEVEAAWLRFENHLWTNNKPAPSVSNVEFISFVPFIGWRRGEHVITDQDIEEKHGHTSIEKAFKQLKSL